MSEEKERGGGTEEVRQEVQAAPSVAAEDGKLSDKAAEPSGKTEKPSGKTVEPSNKTEKPSDKPVEPARDGVVKSEPSDSPAKPASDSTVKPEKPASPDSAAKPERGVPDEGPDLLTDLVRVPRPVRKPAPEPAPSADSAKADTPKRADSSKRDEEPDEPEKPAKSKKAGPERLKQSPGIFSRLLEALGNTRLPKALEPLTRMELPEKVNLPRWLGPIARMNLPNQLTLLRIVLIPLFMAILYWGFPGARYVALLVFILASFTDLLDGKIARKYHLVTDFGKFADPLADKMLVTAAMLWFVEVGRMPAWALLIVICREFAVSGLRMIASDKGRVIAAGWSGKVKTAATMVCVVLMFLPIPDTLNAICVAVITLTTLYSGVEYFLKNKDVIANS